MTIRRGLSLYDFLTAQEFRLCVLPAFVTRPLDRIALDIEHVTETAHSHRWSGTLPAEAFFKEVLKTDAVGIKTLAWSLTTQRAEPPQPASDGTITLEDPSTVRGWRVSLTGIKFRIPPDWKMSFLLPAEVVPADGTDPRFLKRVTEPEATFVHGDLAYFIRTDGTDVVSHGFTGPEDPFSDDAKDGAVAKVKLVPPAAVFSDNADGLGIVLDEVTIDNSKSYTPSTIASADPDWTGLRLKRAGIYLPHSVPLFGSLSLEAEDFLIPLGETPGGLSGEVTVETGRPPATGSTVTIRQGSDAIHVSHQSGYSYRATYARRFDAAGLEEDVTLSASALEPGDWTLTAADGRVIRSPTNTATFGNFTVESGLTLRYRTAPRARETADFKLLKDKPEDAPKASRYPSPDEVITFTGIGTPPGLLHQIDVETASGEAFGNAAFITGSIDRLRTLTFRLSLPPSAGNTPAPEQIVWSIWPEGGAEEAKKVIADPAGTGEALQWDGWQADVSVFVVADFVQRQGSEEDAERRQKRRRILVTPTQSADIYIGHNGARADAQPRIAKVSNGQTTMLADPLLFDELGWKTKPLSEVQTAPSFDLDTGTEVAPVTPASDGTFAVAPGEALIVPIKLQAPKPPEPPRQVETFEAKRVLLAFYDTSEPTLLLNDGPRGTWDPLTGPDRWIDESQRGATIDTFGGIQRSPKPPKENKDLRLAREEMLAIAAAGGNAPNGRAAFKLALWFKSLDLAEEEQHTLVVVSHTSPEDKKEDNEKLASKRAARGEKIAEAAVTLAKLDIVIEVRAEHEARTPSEPDYGFNVPAAQQPLFAGGKAPFHDQQRTRPEAFARKGQMGDLDQGPVPKPAIDTTNLWIGTRATMDSAAFQIERNITFIIVGKRLAPLPPPPEPPEPVRFKVLIPGPEGGQRPPAQPPSGGPATPWRMRARAVWDRPVFGGEYDLVPNLTEVELALPQTILPGRDTATGTEAFSVTGRIERDRFLDEVSVRLGVSFEDDPKGIAEFTHEDIGKAGVAIALFGPTLLGALQQDSPADPGEADGQPGTGQLLDLAAAAAGVGLFATAIDEGRVVWTAASAGGTIPGARIGFGVDYLAEASISAGKPDGVSIRTTEPVAIKWTNVGVKSDWRPLLEDESPKFSVTGTSADFGAAQAEVLSSGRWDITGALGKYVNVKDLALGFGSVELSAVLAPTLSMGDVKLEEVGLKVRWGDGEAPEVTLTSLAASLKVEGMVEAEGRLSVDGPDIAGSLDLRVPPAKINGYAALAIKQAPEGVGGPPMVNLEAGIRFATPMPLGGSGLVLMGVQGRVVANGTRDFAGLPEGDPIGRQLGWARKFPEQKYTHKRGQYAIGFGALLGTAPDTGFCLNASGMLTLGFPEIDVTLVTDIKIVELPGEVPKDDPSEQPTSKAAILGILAVSREGVTIAAEGNVSIPFVLKAHIPLGAHFPTGGQPFFIRLGSDGFAGLQPHDPQALPRPGKPITATLYPGLLSLNGWAFLMIERGGLYDLGADRAEGLNLPGFSVGMGLGFDFRKNYGPFKLSAYMELLAGLGLQPLTIAAQISLGGEIDFGIAAVQVNGKLRLLSSEELFELDGTVTAKISMLFFDLKASARVRIRDEAQTELPPPPSLLKRVSFVDTRDEELEAVEGAGRLEEPVPLDAAIRLQLFPAPSIAQDAAPGFTLPTSQGMQPEWTGSSDLRHAYHVERITLSRTDGGDVAPNFKGRKLPATLVEPPDGDLGGNDAGSAKAISLLSDDPLPWLGNADISDDTTAERLKADLEVTCEAAPLPERSREGLWGIDFAHRDLASWSATSRDAPRWRYRGAASYDPFLAQGMASFMSPLAKRPVHPSAMDSLDGVRSICAGTALSVTGFMNVRRSPFFMPQGAMIFPTLRERARVRASLPTKIALAGPVIDPELTLLSDPDWAEIAHLLTPQDWTCALPLKPNENLRTSQKSHGITYAAKPGFKVVRSRETTALRLQSEGNQHLRITLPDAKDGVRLRMAVAPHKQISRGFGTFPRTFPRSFSAGSVVLRALDASGQQLFKRDFRNATFKSTEIVIDRAGITTLEVIVRNRRVSLEPLCWLDARVFPDLPPRPNVQGLNEFGQWEGFEVEHAGRFGLRNGPFRFVAKPERRGGTYSAMRFAPFAFGYLGLEKLLAASARADAARAAEIERRANRRRHYTRPLSSPAQAGPHGGFQPEIATEDTVSAAARPPLLAPDQDYTLSVQYRVATWVREDPDQEPPLPERAFAGGAAGVTVESAARTETIAFQTVPARRAAEAAAAAFGSAVPRDPRGRHYTGDPLSVCFTSTAVPDLLATAGHKLHFRLRRTDTQSGGALVGADEISAVRGPGRAGDMRGLEETVSDILEGLPCIGTPLLRGESLALSAELDANATYALEIFSKSASGAVSEIGEARFGTSRYQSPDAQLEELGFASRPDRAETLKDKLVSGPLEPGTGHPAPLDKAFAEAAGALGLDAQPSEDPLARGLYMPDPQGSGAWLLAGFQLSSPEPLERDEEVYSESGVLRPGKRLALEEVGLSLRGQTVRFSAAARDANGARWLFVPDGGPISLENPGAGATRALTLTFRQEGSDWRGGRRVTRPATISFHAALRVVPATAEREGLA